MISDYHLTQTIIGTSQLKADGGRLKSLHVKREGPIAKIAFYKRTLFRSVKLAIARSAPDNGSRVGSLANTSELENSRYLGYVDTVKGPIMLLECYYPQSLLSGCLKIAV